MLFVAVWRRSKGAKHLKRKEGYDAESCDDAQIHLFTITSYLYLPITVSFFESFTRE